MAKPACIYVFGPFQLDTGAHRLLRENKPVNLSPKSFDLLQVLIENQGRAMSKLELLEALWPDTQVEESNLAFQVSVLRKALGTEAGSAIETIPRHGYRFSAPVVIQPAANIPDPLSAANETPRRARKRYIATAAVVLVVVAFLVLIATRERTGAAVSGLSATRDQALSWKSGPVISAALPRTRHLT